jgi:Flp pilus assembly protein CpaB
MRSRGLVVAIAAVLAVVAAAAVVLYTNGVKNDAVTGGSLAAVVVANQDIPANTALDPLIDGGAFGELQIPSDAVVDGAVTSLAQLQGLTTTSPVLANEQIPAGRLSSGELPDGGALGITPGNIALSVQVNSDAAVNGAITRGSYITVYATYDNPTIISAKSAEAAINEAAAGTSKNLGAITVTLIPAVRVLDVVNPVPEAEGGAPAQGDVTLTLDLKPQDAQDLTYAQQTAAIRFGLLPPKDTQGHSLPFSAIPEDRVLGRGGA